MYAVQNITERNESRGSDGYDMYTAYKGQTSNAKRYCSNSLK